MSEQLRQTAVNLRQLTAMLRRVPEMSGQTAGEFRLVPELFGACLNNSGS